MRPSPRVVAGGAVVLAAVLTLYAVRPGVVESSLRSPRAWLVVVAVLLTGRATTAVLQRLTGRARTARTAGALVPLLAAVLLLAPSFQQRELTQPFPPAAASPAVTLADPAPAAPRPTAPPPTAPPPVVAAPPRLLSSGPLEGIGHSARGTVALYATGDGTVLRFEDVDVEGTIGPSVHLVPRGARTPAAGVRLAPLRAERGSFGYALPADLAVDPSWTVLVWCDPFDTPIAAADLGGR